MTKVLSDLIEDFLRYLRVQQGRNLLTVRNYRLYLKRFLNWCEGSRLQQATEITKDKLRDYRLWLTHQKSLNGINLSAATQNYHLTALRSFVNYLKHKGIPTLLANNISLNPPQKRKLTILTNDEVAALHEAVKKSREPELVKLRDQLIVDLIYSCGLKVSELVVLNNDQINQTNSQLNLTRSGKKVALSLTANIIELAKKYLNERGDKNSALFIRHDRAVKTKNAGRLTARSVQRSLERYRKLAGLKQKITPHTLRHSFAAGLAQQGADLATLQQRLGLKHRSTASVYNIAKPTKH